MSRAIPPTTSASVPNHDDHGSRQAAGVDELMERASRALASADYFEADRLGMKALDRAWHLHDFERMARIALPVQEARRQIRQLAADAGRRFVLRSMPARQGPLEAGCYLLEPPMIGMEARTLRDMLDRKKVPGVVVTREPLTKKGTWPIVAVASGPSTPVSIRVYVVPPEGTPGVEWFLQMKEKLGDAAITKLEAGPAAWQVDDLLHYLDAVPDHERLWQALAEACRRATKEPLPAMPRRRGFDNPYSF